MILMALCFFFIDDKPVDFCKYLRGPYIYISARLDFFPTPVAFLSLLQKCHCQAFFLCCDIYVTCQVLYLDCDIYVTLQDYFKPSPK